MRTSLLLLAAISSIGSLSSCAGYKVLHIAANDHDTPGIRYCRSMPYLLVSTITDKKEAAAATTTLTYQVIYLPDPAETYVVQRHGGLGSADVGMTLTESGVITVFNGKTDSKIPETITAVGSILSSVLAAKSGSGSSLVTPSTEPGLYKIDLSVNPIKLVKVKITE